MANRLMTEKKLAESIETFGKQDQANAKLAKSLAIQAILFAAEHGRTDYIGQFQSKVSKATSDAFSAFLGNVLKIMGTPYNQDGKEKQTLFFDYSRRETRWVIVNEKSGANEARLEAAKANREAFKKLSESDFDNVIFGRMDSRSTTAAQAMDTEAFDKRLNNLLMKAAKDGAAPNSKLLQIAKFIQTDAFKITEYDLKEASTKLETDAKAAREKAERLEAVIASRKTEGDPVMQEANDEAENIQVAA